MENTHQSVNFLKEISNLLVRSPSCSCVLSDVLELITDFWQAEEVTIVIKSKQGEFLPIAGVTGKTPQYMLSLPKTIFLSTMEGQAEKISCKKVKGKLLLSDEGNYYLIFIPLWTSNKIIGIFALLTEKKNIDAELDLTILEVITNQIGFSLEKEFYKEKTDSSEMRFDSIINSLNEGIIMLQDKVVYCNSKAFELLRMNNSYANKEIDQFCAHLVKISKNPSNTIIYLETFLLANSFYYFTIETRDNRFLKFSKFDVQNVSGETLCKGLLLSDVTEYKEKERFKDTLISILSHELKTPLTIINGNATSLLRTDIRWEEADRQEFLKEISEECHRLNDMVGELLAISLINAKKYQLHKRFITIGSFTDKVYRTISRAYAKQGNITFTVKNKDDVFEIDEQKVQQVIQNLIDNAVKYGPRHVKVNVYVKREGDRVLFIIKDNGPGISKDALDKIFQQYYQVKPERTSINKGSGLGLSICKGIVEAHGGSIWAESTLGKGSDFCFTLPVNKVKVGDYFE
ncbi:histidine kinase [Desulfitobacterium dehalogenans ATCC 51507]|uniref:histidine kinase n=1 Tax=Desulfitobacterium dehalogenans (strain ATCC 51507 / DSM 9161 / JW/IU-DC1) TaxID=756499 RepID=I4AEH4_DESDJ|nr:histidine kinase [Desulfitobacterium dehalogenans ATCC 51507]